MEKAEIEALARRALEEDVGSGDVTASAVIPPGATGTGEIVARRAGVLCGVEIAAAVFRALDPDVEVQAPVADGEAFSEGDVVLRVRGRAGALVTGERTALNFLQRLSGIATHTRAFVEAIEGTDARIYDTRKTTPLLRAAEKLAVRAGGGENHRRGLHDQAMIKENHLAFLPEGDERALADAVAAAREAGGSVVVEARTREEALDAAHAGADVVLLDNFEVDELPEVIGALRALPEGGPRIEVSGGVDLGTVRAIAETGPDRISVGALTHSAPSIDLSMGIRPDISRADLTDSRT